MESHSSPSVPMVHIIFTSMAVGRVRHLHILQLADTERNRRAGSRYGRGITQTKGEKAAQKLRTAWVRPWLMRRPVLRHYQRLMRELEKQNALKQVVGNMRESPSTVREMPSAVQESLGKTLSKPGMSPKTPGESRTSPSNPGKSAKHLSRKPGNSPGMQGRDRQCLTKFVNIP